jgi:hypothetical protein
VVHHLISVGALVLRQATYHHHKRTTSVTNVTRRGTGVVVRFVTNISLTLRLIELSVQTAQTTEVRALVEQAMDREEEQHLEGGGVEADVERSDTSFWGLKMVFEYCIFIYFV